MEGWRGPAAVAAQRQRPRQPLASGRVSSWGWRLVGPRGLVCLRHLGPGQSLRNCWRDLFDTTCRRCRSVASRSRTPPSQVRMKTRMWVNRAHRDWAIHWRPLVDIRRCRTPNRGQSGEEQVCHLQRPGAAWDLCISRWPTLHNNSVCARARTRCQCRTAWAAPRPRVPSPCRRLSPGSARQATRNPD